MNARSWFVLAVAACIAPLSPCAAADDKKPDAKPREIDAATVGAWEKRGFEVGWLIERDGSIQFGTDRPTGGIAIPGFRPARFDAIEDLKDLPQAEVPFGFYLSFREVKDDRFKHLATLKSLTAVGLYRVKLNAVALGGLGELKELTLLDVQCPYLKADANELTGLTKLTYLNLNRIGVTDASAEKFARCPKLATLKLISSEITNAGFAHLTALNDLTYLDLSDSRITDDGLKHIAAFKKLTALTLPWSALTDRGLRALRDANQLHLLNEAKAPRDQRPARDEDIAALDLRGASVTGPGLKALAGLKDLTLVSLDDAQITDGALRTLKELNLLHVLKQAYGKNGRVTKDEDVTGFSLGESSPLTDAGLKTLTACPNIQSLYLERVKVTDKGFKELCAFKQLTFLTISTTEVTDDGLKEIAGLTKLETLIFYSPNITDAGLEHLATLKTPKLLWIVEKPPAVTEDGLKKLRAARPDCGIKVGPLP